MKKDWFLMLAEGWNIIESYSDTRTGARQLCRLFSEILGAALVGLEFHEDENYAWNEQVERIGIPSSTGKWKLYMNNSKSHWFFDGATDYMEELKLVIDLLTKQWLYKKNYQFPKKRYIKPDYTALFDNSGWVTVSSSSRNLLSTISQYYLTANPLLLLGTSGSGKKYLAEILHKNSYDPSLNPWNADKNRYPGTLFIAEWASLSRRRQQFYLQGKNRIVAAATPDEFNENQRRNWETDTLNKGRIIKVPSLVERLEDIPLLTSCFIDRATASLHRYTVPGVSETVMDILLHYSWPGSVQELKECIFHALCDMAENSKNIEMEHLPAAIRGQYPNNLPLLGQTRSY